MASVWLQYAVHLFIYLLSERKGFHHKAQDLYKGASQVTKTDIVQLNNIINIQKPQYNVHT